MVDSTASPQRKLPAPGDLLGGKYRIVRSVGEGGMGVVFEGRHEKLGQRVAIKVVRVAADQAPEEYFQRFEREARAAAKLRSVHVARVSDVDTLEDGTPYMVLEYLEGIDLDEELSQRGVLPIQEAVGYVLQACSAVAEAHSRGIVHRDLKPHNLFLAEDGQRKIVKLLDFGISRMESSDEKSVTLTRTSLGTPLYMSPEQIRSTRHADERSDIWSLGVIAYELLTGRTPFDGESPSAVIAAISADIPDPPIKHRTELPPTLSAAVMKALQKDPSLRYQKVTELADALLPYGPRSSWQPPPDGERISLTRLTIPDAPTVRVEANSLHLSDSPTVHEPEPVLVPRKKPLWPIAVGVLLLGALGVAIWGFRHSSSKDSVTAAAATESTPSSPEKSALAPVERPVAEPRVEPALAGSIASPATTTHATSATKKPVAGKPGAKPSAPEPAASAAPKPPPPPSDNPVHL